MKRKDIICISTHYWRDFWFRKQQFMSRFHQKGHKILYVQPSFSVLRKPRVPGIARNRILIPLLQKLDPNLYLFSPPRMLPKPTNPLSAKFNYKWFSYLVGMAARKAGMEAPVLWLYKPEYAVGLNAIKYSRLVFDLADDLSAYRKKSKDIRFVGTCMEALACKADRMIVTSPTLFEKYRDRNRTCVWIPNGFDSSLFNGNRQPVPADLASITPPIVGFVGALFKFLDYDLIYNIVSKHSDKSFVFIGPSERRCEKEVAQIKRLPNSYFLGRKDKQMVPRYVSNFNVCINPFKVDDVSKSVSPLKVYEYLACGKPVISTKMEGLVKDDAGKYVYFAKHKEEFSGMITRVLHTETEEKKRQRLEGIKPYSWDRLFDRAENVFNSMFE